MGDMSNEPSMEEILASIKKIIAEEETAPQPKARRSAPRDAAFDELGEEVAPIETVDAVPVTESAPEAPEVLELTESVEEIAAAPVVPMAPVAQLKASLVSSATEAASRNALASLSAMVVRPEVHGSDTLEGMVREMLKPMLTAWLDTHLPEVVERVVAQEVARISGRPA